MREIVYWKFSSSVQLVILISDGDGTLNSPGGEGSINIFLFSLPSSHLVDGNCFRHMARCGIYCRYPPASSYDSSARQSDRKKERTCVIIITNNKMTREETARDIPFKKCPNAIQSQEKMVPGLRGRQAAAGVSCWFYSTP